jgi:hypothetical protein
MLLGFLAMLLGLLALLLGLLVLLFYSEHFCYFESTLLIDFQPEEVKIFIAISDVLQNIAE